MKVVVVGAGPAGCMAAIEACKRGADVVVVEHRWPPRGICAGGVILSRAKRYGIDESLFASSLVTRVKTIAMHSPSGYVAEFKVNGSVIVVDRMEFDAFLREKAADAGAVFHKSKALSVERNVVRTRHGRINFDKLVVATGSPRRLPGLPRRRIRPDDAYICVQTTVEHKPEHDIEIYFGHHVAPRGYAWVFAQRKRRLSKVGLGVPASLGFYAVKFLKRLARMERVRALGKIEAKALYLTEPARKVSHGNVLFAGDSIPSTRPPGGAGIVEAMASGRMAGRCAVSEEDYERMWWDTLGREIAVGYKLKTVLTELDDCGFDVLVRMLRR